MPGAGRDSNLILIRFSVRIYINIIILIIVNKQGLKLRSEEFVAGSLGRGELTKGVLSPTSSSVTSRSTSGNVTGNFTEIKLHR